MIPRYRGYMQSQAMRLLGLRGGGGGRRGGGGREELIEAHGYDTKYAMHCARLGFQCLELLDTGHLNLPIQGEPADWLRAVRAAMCHSATWWNRSLELDAQLEGWYRTSPCLPNPIAPESITGSWEPTDARGTGTRNLVRDQSAYPSARATA